jgi:hypothetical protein
LDKAAPVKAALEAAPPAEDSEAQEVFEPDEAETDKANIAAEKAALEAAPGDSSEPFDKTEDSSDEPSYDNQQLKSYQNFIENRNTKTEVSTLEILKVIRKVLEKKKKDCTPEEILST